MYFLLSNLFILLAILHQAIDAADWNYGDEGPDVWSDTYPSCAGYSQSPINIDTTSTVHLSFTPFKFTTGYNMAHNFTLTNNGHTIVGVYSGNEPSDMSFQGGGLVGTFGFYSFHLHWGENYKSGSEHQV
jgi:carbonic anhydrase